MTAPTATAPTATAPTVTAPTATAPTALLWRRPLLRRSLAVVCAVTLLAAACGDDADDLTVAPPEEASAADGTAAPPEEASAPEDGADPDGTTAPDEPVAAADAVEVTQGGDLLQTVQERGRLVCGVSGTRVIFSETDPDGSVVGVDADYCRVVAAALFGDAGAVDYVSLTTAERFTALQTGVIDVLIRSTTWTQSRDTDLGLDFGPVIYYDGQQLMARAGDNFTSASGVADIAGAVVCALSGTTTEKNVSDAADAAGIDITLNTFEDFDTITDNFIRGACDVITADGSSLAGRKAKQQPDDQEWVIFPATPISKEPLAPVYPHNQSRFGDVVNWAVSATIIADEKGITSENVAEMAASPPDAEVGRLLGGEGELQSAMGLAPDAFYQAILQVGNYDEILSRHLGAAGLGRAGTPNASWRDGGLVYAPPAR